LHSHVTAATAPLVFEAAQRANDQSLQARSIVALQDHIGALRADRQSPLYMVSSTARASIMRYFPSQQDAAEPAPAAHQQFAAAPNPRQMHPPDLRQRSTSDALSVADAAGAAQRNGAFPSPSSLASSPSSTLRGGGGGQARSPYPAHDAGTPRRPWDASIMGSPVITSPASSRQPGKSPEARSGGALADGGGSSSKRLSGVSQLAAQPLPEDTAVSYGRNGGAAPLDSATHASRSKRASRYLGSLGGAAPAESAESVATDRRPSDTSSLNEAAMLIQTPQLPPPQLQPPQPQPQTSSRSLIFRPWNKMKKIASSSHVSADSLPPALDSSASYGDDSSTR
ncbi:hypothetical protein IWQ57_003022, partial [Coemansia nantahalensis]